MKNNEVSIFVFIASIIIGLLISFNINLKPTEPKVQLNSKQYQDAVKKKNKLYNEIAKLSKMNQDISDKINEYNYSTQKEEKLVKDINDEFEKNKLIVGLSEAHGKGIRIKINDAWPTSEVEDKSFEGTMLKTIHDEDMSMLMNSLKIAGAQGIAINGERFIFNSEIECFDAFLRINKTRVPGPFNIDVIGDSEILKSSLLSTRSYLKILINRGISVEVEAFEDLKLPAYKGKINLDNIISNLK